MKLHSLLSVRCLLLPFFFAVFFLASWQALATAASKDTPQEVVVIPQLDAKPGQAKVNGVEVEDPDVDPAAAAAAAAMEDRIMRYKFILESLGFVLEEVVFSPDWEHTAELIFTGRLNSTREKLQELAEKFPDEQRLMDTLRTVHAYNNRDLTNYGAYKVILRLSQPVGIQVHYRRF